MDADISETQSETHLLETGLHTVFKYEDKLTVRLHIQR